jgi:hypothetical protein
MADLDVAGLRQAINDVITEWAAGAPSADPSPTNEITEVVDDRVLPEGQRVVRTKSSGDRVYLLKDAEKTRQWVTNPEVLAKLGFAPGDVVDVDDNELMKYNMGPALYKAN